MVVSGGNSHTKEMSIRRRIANIFNKREEDFQSLKEYNDYLEEVEVMRFNLVEGVDVPEMEERIREYEQENAEQIIINREAEELIAALAASKGLPAQNCNDGSSQVGIGIEPGQYAPTVAGGQPRPLGPVSQPGGQETQGYFEYDEETARIRAEKGGRAAGWTMDFSKRRALEEAFSSFWI